MGMELTIDPETGILSIGSTSLQPQQRKSEIEPKIASMLKGRQDHGNGSEWLYVEGLSFGGQPASVDLCFNDGRLELASWNVQLADTPSEGGWPTREAIDTEVTFVRSVLAQNGITVGDHPKKYHWGELWSTFDPKGFLASNGLRYRQS